MGGVDGLLVLQRWDVKSSTKSTIRDSRDSNDTAKDPRHASHKEALFAYVLELGLLIFLPLLPTRDMDTMAAYPTPKP